MSVSRLPVFQVEWVNTQQPKNEEIATFTRDTSLTPVDAEFLAEHYQRPEIVVRPNYTLILINVPVFEKRMRVTSSASLAFVALEDTLYTLHHKPIVTLEKLRKEIEENPAKHEPNVGTSSLSLALYIITHLNNSNFRKLNRLVKHVDIAEDAVFFGDERKMVEEIAVLSRDVLDFRRIMRPHKELFASLPDMSISPDIRSRWQRVHGQMRQLWEYLEALHDSTKELRETNDSLLQHKENELLRLLSMYSIIAIPIWIFVAPYNPRMEDANMADFVIFWGILVGLVLFLVWIFVRARRAKVL